jgi:hypothetical protein
MRDSSEGEHGPADLVIDETLDLASDGPVLAGHDGNGQQYLIVDRGGSWVCAPISPLGRRCLVSGRANLSDAFRHTLTGYVLVLSVGAAGEDTTSTLLCRDLPDDLLPHHSLVLAA